MWGRIWVQAQAVSLQSPCFQLPCLCFLLFINSSLLLDLYTHWSYYLQPLSPDFSIVASPSTCCLDCCSILLPAFSV